MAKRMRTTFWVVSTHVLTTGLAIPVVAGLIAAGIVSAVGIQQAEAVLAIDLACVTAGYVGGTYYSLSFLRSTALHERWSRCLGPSIVVFAVFALIGFPVNVFELPQREMLPIGMLALTYAVMIVVFARISQAGFAKLELSNSAPTAVVALPANATITRPSGAWSRRLVGAGVGLSGGFVIGIVMSTQMAGNDWSMHLLTGAVVGVFGGLLGLSFGLPRG